MQGLYRAKDGCEELTNMEQDPEEQAIVEWLQTVDKPLTTKEGDKKDTEASDE